METTQVDKPIGVDSAREALRSALRDIPGLDWQAQDGLGAYADRILSALPEGWELTKRPVLGTGLRHLLTDILQVRPRVINRARILAKEADQIAEALDDALGEWTGTR